MSMVSAPAPIQSLVPSTRWLASLRCAYPSNGDFTPPPPRGGPSRPHTAWAVKQPNLNSAKVQSLCNSHPLLPGLSWGARQRPQLPLHKQPNKYPSAAIIPEGVQNAMHCAGLIWRLVHIPVSYHPTPTFKTIHKALETFPG